MVDLTPDQGDPLPNKKNDNPPNFFFQKTIFERIFKAVSFCASRLVLVALGILAIRAAVRLESHWDTFAYHLPLAALRGGLAIPFEISNGASGQGFYQGFPPLAHLVQGLLWRITGSINATGTINYLAFVLFLAFCHLKLHARFWLVAMLALTAPLVLIHTTVSYIDLFGNSFLAIGVSTFASMFLFERQNEGALLLMGLAGLSAAAWTKFQLVPIVAIFFMAFALLYLSRCRGQKDSLAKALKLIFAMGLLAAIPYLKNFAFYGNPFWPVKIGLFGELFPYMQEMDMGKIALIERPPPLADFSQPRLFIHSLFEIDHPTFYAHRNRWIIDQGGAWLAYRMGGFWHIFVVISLLATAMMAIYFHRRKGFYLLMGSALLLSVIAFFPQSHELRYLLFIPLCWASIIGMLFPIVTQKKPFLASTLLVLFSSLFLYMAYVNRAHYNIERAGLRQAADAWFVLYWWNHLKPNLPYCVVNS